MLRLLNLDLTRDADPPLASVVTARFDPGTSTMSWAQAGHFAPVLLRGERGRPLACPAGGLLGLRPDAGYGQATQRLRPRDVVVFFTDGVLDPADRSGSPVRSLVRSLVRELVRAYRQSGSGDLHDRFLPSGEGEACLVTVERAPA